MEKNRQGLLHIYCGDGKGKTSAAVGMAVRAAGCGMKVLVIRFLKTENSGEVEVLRSIPGITVPPCERTFGFVFRMTEEQKQEAALYYQSRFEAAAKKAVQGQYDLLILDEIGRGTSTFDGLSIAWAVIEHISNRKLLGAKTLFATHYHELTELEGKMNNVNNYCIAVKECGDDIVFLRKIVKGGADKSYGIQVAKLAGVPDMVIDRAKEIVEQLSDNDITETVQSSAIDNNGDGKAKKQPKYDEVDLAQMSLFDTVTDEDVLKELMEIEVTTLTPLDALNTLYRLQNKLKNRWNG